MRLVIQRVEKADVTVENEIVGSIGKGLLVFIGISQEDNENIADRYLKKLINLRIFEDKDGKTNLALSDVGGELLLVSQFTLYANCKKGNRPSFDHAGNPVRATQIYEYMIEESRKFIGKVECGRFGADMKVGLVNDGPFTIVLDESIL